MRKDKSQNEPQNRGNDLLTISVKKLCWSPKKGGSPVLKNITLELEQGKVYGIIGPNGSGKTSLLRHILRFLPVQEGEIRLGGRDIASRPRRALARELSYVPQETRLDADLSALDLVLTGRSPHIPRFGREGEKDMELARSAMSLTGTAQLEERQFDSLSGGEAQRVVVARAVAQGSPWMLLDEPVSNLDVAYQVQILRLLQDLSRRQGVSVVIVLHDINLAGAFCDSLLMMKEGSLLKSGPTEDVLNAESLEELYGIPFLSVSGADGILRWYPLLER